MCPFCCTVSLKLGAEDLIVSFWNSFLVIFFFQFFLFMDVMLYYISLIGSLCQYAVLGNWSWIGESLQWSNCTSRCCDIWWALCTCKFWSDGVEGICYFFFSFFQIVGFTNNFNMVFGLFVLIQWFFMAEQSYRQS